MIDSILNKFKATKTAKKEKNVNIKEAGVDEAKIKTIRSKFVALSGDESPEDLDIFGTKLPGIQGFFFDKDEKVFMFLVNFSISGAIRNADEALVLNEEIKSRVSTIATAQMICNALNLELQSK